MSELRTGDTVRVVVEKAYVKSADSSPPLFLVDGRMLHLPTHLPSVTVEVTKRAQPENWPPRYKDVWRSNASGGLWLAIDIRDPDSDYLTDVPEIRLVASYDCAPYVPSWVLKNYPDIKLIHREEDQ